jgi:hypothetical protein
VQFLVHELAIASQHIDKLATEDFWILRYHGSRSFTFLFFMQKLSGNSPDKFNKTCSSLHQETSKTEFAFFLLFYDFLVKDSANWLYYLRYGFTPGSLKRSKASQVYPWFTEKPQERPRALQCGPWGGGGAAPANSGEAGGALDRVGAQGDVHAHLGLVCARRWAEGQPTAAHGDDRRWRPRWPRLRQEGRTGWATSGTRSTRES